MKAFVIALLAGAALTSQAWAEDTRTIHQQKWQTSTVGRQELSTAGHAVNAQPQKVTKKGHRKHKGKGKKHHAAPKAAPKTDQK